jgi:hypothetical protein
MNISETKLLKPIKGIKETSYCYTSYSDENNKWEVESIIEKTFNDKEQLIEEKEIYFNDDQFGNENQITKYNYNLFGKLIKKISYDDYDDLISKETFEYDNSGRLIHVSIQEPDNIIWDKSFIYDVENILIEINKVLSSASKPNIETTSFKYNSLKQKIEEIDSLQDYGITRRKCFRYDKFGCLAECHSYNKKNILNSIAMYNIRGGLVLEEEYDLEGNIESKRTFEYNEFGNILSVKYIDLRFPDENYEIKNTFVYDKFENWTKKTSINNHIPSRLIEREIEYYTEPRKSQSDSLISQMETPKKIVPQSNNIIMSNDFSDFDLKLIFNGMQATRDLNVYLDIETHDVFLDFNGRYLNLKNGNELEDIYYIDNHKHVLLPHLKFMKFKEEFTNISIGNQVFIEFIDYFSSWLVNEMSDFVENNYEILFTEYLMKDMDREFKNKYGEDNIELIEEYYSIFGKTVRQVSKNWISHPSAFEDITE